MTGIFEVRPSDVSPDDIAPELQVFGGTYDTNVPHIVYPAINTETLIVLVSGTGATSASGSFLSSVNETHKLPVIGLSYIFGPFTDAHRNEMIKNGPNGRDPRVQQEILRGYHEDVLFGGNKSGLVDIPYNSSLTTRFLNLLLYLIRERPAEEGWIKFLTEESLPFWERILFVGYSQGAGHLLYLATRERFRGLILISGSQEIVPEDCEGTSWMEEAVYRTSNMFAFKHEREENGALMDLNWRSIKPLRLSKEEYAHTREQEKLRGGRRVRRGHATSWWSVLSRQRRAAPKLFLLEAFPLLYDIGLMLS